MSASIEKAAEPLYVAYSAGWDVFGDALRRQRLWRELAADLAVHREGAKEDRGFRAACSAARAMRRPS